MCQVRFKHTAQPDLQPSDLCPLELAGPMFVRNMCSVVAMQSQGRGLLQLEQTVSACVRFLGVSVLLLAYSFYTVLPTLEDLTLWLRGRYSSADAVQG